LDRQDAVVNPDPSGPEAANLLEMRRRMLRILLQPRVRLIGEVLDIRR
jgi:hypothetical protein